MESNSKDSQWLCFAGLSKYSIWRTMFEFFAQTKGHFFDTISGDDLSPNLPRQFGNDPINQKRPCHDAAQISYKSALNDFHKRKRQLLMLPGYNTRFSKLDDDKVDKT